jgi:hypothetical protein
MFSLKCKKEIMPYNIYTEDSIKENIYPIRSALDELDPKDHTEFLKNLHELNLIVSPLDVIDKTNKNNDISKEPITIKDKDSMLYDFNIMEYPKKIPENKKPFNEELSRNLYFKHIDYANFYCIQDCKVLCEGYMKFRQMIKSEIELDIDNFVSSPQIAHQYMIDSGVYDDCFKLSGVVREFIGKAVIGGRVMCRQNKKWHTKEVLNDFDAVSLYPSAMRRMSYLVGKPNLIPIGATFDDIKDYDGYFIEILITKVKKRYDFPLINFMKPGQSRKFTDDINELRDTTIIVDKITLEDWIKYQGIEFKLIKGYYFNEGRNTTICGVIGDVFNLRLYYKGKHDMEGNPLPKEKWRKKNPIEQVYKLIMNSSYGKTIMKPIETDSFIFDNTQELVQYVEYNVERIKTFNLIPGSTKWIAYVDKPIYKHFASPHIGSEILSMSKRIMNEVMCLAEDNNLDMYYTDTDSIHIKDSHIKELEILYKKKYNRDLIGPFLGQFHNDFSLKSDKGFETVAVESIFLGKKCYIDKLKATIRDEITGLPKPKYDYHIRMKGIPTKCIKKKCDELDKTPVDLYNKLYNGEQIEFNLIYNKNVVKFRFGKNMKFYKMIYGKDKFTRRIRFA